MSKYDLRYLIAEFIETDSNILAKNFLQNYGFAEFTRDLKIDDSISSIDFGNNKSYYYLDTKNVEIPNIDIFNGAMKYES